MANFSSNPIMTTSLEYRQSTSNSDERNDCGTSSVTRVSVITSTHSLPNSLKKTHDNINMIAISKSSDDKAETKKPYGGRPLKYECPQCQRRFHAPSHLKRHVMSHSSERPFQCTVCGKGFLQAWHLGRHMTTHTGNKPFKCDECSKSFGSRFEMRTHINYIHKGIKEHKCDVCGKHFTLRSNLKVHMRKHTGEKPYECIFCSKRFGQRGHLQYHIRKHEGKDDLLAPNEASKTREKSIAYPLTKHGSVSEQSECHDEDCECDSGIGSYDSEAESSSCSSPVIHGSNYDDQQSSCDAQNLDRPSSPEFGKVDGSRQSPIKRTLSKLYEPEVRPYLCYSCHSGFSEASSLRAHTRYSHNRKGIKLGSYRCGFCLQQYSSTEDLQVHVDEKQCREATPHQPGIQNRSPSCIDPKPKMSANSLAFTIDNICAQPRQKSPPPRDLHHYHPQINSPPRNPLLGPTIVPSIPVTCHASAMNGYPAHHTSRCMLQSQLTKACQCHLSMYNLQIH